MGRFLSAWRTKLVCGVLIGASSLGSVQAQEPKLKVAAVSLVGDQISVTQYQPSVGSYLDRNDRQVVKITDAYFDSTVLRAIDRSISKAKPGLELIPLRVNDPAIKALHEKSADQGGDAKPLVAALVTAIRGVNATHLIIVTSIRNANQVALVDGRFGTGFLEGLGFYVDRSVRTRSVNTGESALGFIAPHAYMRVMLVDTASGAIVADERALASRATAAYGKEDDDPWRGVSETQKINMLDGLITKEISRVAPLLLEKTAGFSR